MNSLLYDEYLALLKQYGLKPRDIPENSKELEQHLSRHILKLSEEDPVFYNILKKSIKSNADQDTKIHPAQFLLNKASKSIEKSIGLIPEFKDKLDFKTFVGEFPTGDINAQVVNANHGYLILINSGLMVVIKQVVEYLVAGDPDRPRDREVNKTAIDGVIEVLKAYITQGDPFFGPKPLSGGIEMLLVHALTEKTRSFVIAHEYGHIFGGHFSGNVLKTESISTRVGDIKVLSKEYQQELEADTIAQKILLGVKNYDDLDVSVIDSAMQNDEREVLGDALMVKAAFAGPIIILTIAGILEDVWKVKDHVNGKTSLKKTHPPARIRMDNMMDCISKFSSKYTGFVNFASILWAHNDEIVERLCKSILKQ